MLSRQLLPIHHPRSPPETLQRLLLPIGNTASAAQSAPAQPAVRQRRSPPAARPGRPPGRKSLKHVSRRELVSFLVSTAHAIGHSESDLSEAEDVIDVKEAAHACFLSFLDKGLEKSASNNNNNSKGTQIIERVLHEVVNTLKKRCGVFANSHALAAALHNLGCFYAADSDQIKAMAMCSRALNMRRALFEDGDRALIPDTPRDKERDERALGESLNDMGVLNIMRASKETNLKRRDKSLDTGEKYMRDAKKLFDRIHHFLHPICIIMLRNMAWVRHARGYRSEAANLVREALSRARLALSTSRSRGSMSTPRDGHSNPACLVVDCCLCFVSMCFRHQHLTDETRKCLREALRVNQEAFPDTHHFESMRILHKLSQLYFSRRSYKKARHWNDAARKMSFEVKPCLEARMQILEINQDAQAIAGRLQRIDEAKARARKEARRLKEEEEAKMLLLSGQDASHILNPHLAQPLSIVRPKSAVAGNSSKRRKNKRHGAIGDKQARRRRPKSAAPVPGRRKNGSRRPNSSHRSNTARQTKNQKQNKDRHHPIRRQRRKQRERPEPYVPSVLRHGGGTHGGGTANEAWQRTSPLTKSAWFQGKTDRQTMSWMARDEAARNQQRIEERKAKEVHWVHARHQERLDDLQRVMEQKGGNYRYDREAAILRRSVYLSPRDPPVKLIPGVRMQARGFGAEEGKGGRQKNKEEGGEEEEEEEGCGSPMPNMRGLPTRRAQSASFSRRSPSPAATKTRTTPHGRVRGRKRPMSSSPTAAHARSMMWVSVPRMILPGEAAAAASGNNNNNNNRARGDGLFPEPSVSSKHGDLTNHILHTR
jgi:tetratricopeptide (TPR) repeat protein